MEIGDHGELFRSFARQRQAKNKLPGPGPRSRRSLGRTWVRRRRLRQSLAGLRRANYPGDDVWLYSVVGLIRKAMYARPPRQLTQKATCRLNPVSDAQKVEIVGQCAILDRFLRAYSVSFCQFKKPQDYA